MKFEETGCERIEVPKTVFVYFLVKDDEVVYVGQTKMGLSRPLHHLDKDFDSIYAMYCQEDELDELEDKYIWKYLPKYNKAPNCAVNVSLRRVKEAGRKRLCRNISITHVKKAIRALGIQPRFIDMKPYVNKRDVDTIIDFIDSEL